MVIKLRVMFCRGPDLKLMENIWSTLIRRVYANYKEITSEIELEVNIARQWCNINETSYIFKRKAICVRITLT